MPSNSDTTGNGWGGRWGGQRPGAPWGAGGAGAFGPGAAGMGTGGPGAAPGAGFSPRPGGFGRGFGGGFGNRAGAAAPGAGFGPAQGGGGGGFARGFGAAGTTPGGGFGPAPGGGFGNGAAGAASGAGFGSAQGGFGSGAAGAAPGGGGGFGGFRGGAAGAAPGAGFGPAQGGLGGGGFGGGAAGAAPGAGFGRFGGGFARGFGNGAAGATPGAGFGPAQGGLGGGFGGGAAGAAPGAGFGPAQGGFGGSFGPGEPGGGQARPWRWGRAGAGAGFAGGRFAGATPGGAADWTPPDAAPAGPAPSHNERIRQFYAVHLAHDGQSEIFRDTEFWNWGYWTPTTRSQNEACENLLELLLSFLPEKSGRILDVACGKGATTRHLLRYYDPATVMGINVSPEQIAVCRERLPEVRFEEMDAATLDLPDASVDTIVCVEAMCHFDTRAAFLREALRVLKPGGRLVFSDSLLRAGTAIQPEANYLETAEQYGEVGRSAGFAEVQVYDTTEESWRRFAQFQMGRAMERLRNREILPRNVRLTAMWLRRTAPVAYVAGWMRKAPSGGAEAGGGA